MPATRGATKATKTRAQASVVLRREQRIDATERAAPVAPTPVQPYNCAFLRCKAYPTE